MVLNFTAVRQLHSKHSFELHSVVAVYSSSLIAAISFSAFSFAFSASES